MKHKHSQKIKNLFGYLVMVGLFVGSYWLYLPEIQPDFMSAMLKAALAAMAITIIVITVSIFWLWEEKRVEQLERIFGVLGHIPHCAYCLSLWLSLFAVPFFKISFAQVSFFAAANLNLIAEFLMTWLAVSFLSVLFSSLLINLWFQKIYKEFQIREKYRGLTDKQF